MSELTQFENAGLPADPNQLKAGLQNARNQAPAVGAGVLFMKMNQFGSPHEGLLTYGPEAVEVQDGSEWVVNWKGMQHGFLLRDGASVKAEVYAPIFQPLPQDLRPTVGSESWRQAYKCQLVCVSGEDIGTVCEYSGDAGGVVKLFKQVLLPAIEGQLDVDANKLYPALTFTVTSYHSKKQSKDVYEAHGKIVAWFSEDELNELAGGDKPAPQVEAKPEAPAPEPAAETAAAEPAPERTATRRRRRAAAS